MAIRKSSISGTPFGDSSNRPANPQVGQTYYNGQLGYLEIYTESGWIPATGANDFSLNLGGTHTSINLTQSYSSGSYSIVSSSNDTTMDIYAYAADGSLAGYTNSKSFTATQRFTKMVILGGSTNDVLSFSYKTTYPTTVSTSDLTSGPYITSISPSGMPNINDTITITGGNFANNVAVHFTGTGYSSTAAKNIVRSSSTSLVVTRPDNFPVSGSPYSVVVTNPSVANQPTGSNSHIYAGITAGAAPIWQTSSTVNTTFTLNNAASLTLSATDADGGSNITYSYASGSLPTGLSFNAETGVISGTGTVINQSTNYTVRATDSGGNIADRTFTITIVYPVITGGTLSSDATHYYRTFTNTGTLSVTGTLSADILVVGGGGSGGCSPSGASFTGSGGGGAGAILYKSGHSLTTKNYEIQVGAGGAIRNTTSFNNGSNGGDSIFDVSDIAITALGGGGGSNAINKNSGIGANGGSGGGGSNGDPTGSTYTSGHISGGPTNGGRPGGTAQSTTPSGWTLYANAGGAGAADSAHNVHAGGGGGGAGGAGSLTRTAYHLRAGDGGVGTSVFSSWASATSTGSGGFYAGGGGGGTYSWTNDPDMSESNWSSNFGNYVGRGGSGGGGNGSVNNFGPSAGSGSASTGGGGGGGGYTQAGANGGSGVVIVRYTRAQVGG